MTVTVYNPDGFAVAANSMIGVTLAVANIQAPTLAELTAGTVFQCATEAFGSTTTVSTVERKKLCHTVAQKRRGNMSYDDVTLTFTLDDPQGATQGLLDIFANDAKVFLFHRPGMTHTSALAATQKVQVIEAIVMNRDLAELTTNEGSEYQATVVLGVQARTDLLVPIAT